MQGNRVSLTDGSKIVANTNGSQNGGEIAIHGSQLKIQDGAFVSAVTLGSGRGGDLRVIASESVEIVGTGQYEETIIKILQEEFQADEINDGLFTASFGTGAVGNLTIETEQITAQKGALISSSTFREGLGGNLSIIANESVNINEASLITGTASPQAAGDLTITTGRLIVENGAIATLTLGEGPGGNLIISAAELVEVFGTGPVEVMQIF